MAKTSNTKPKTSRAGQTKSIKTTKSATVTSAKSSSSKSNANARTKTPPAAPVKTKKKMSTSKKVVIVVIILLLITLAIGIIFWLMRQKEQQSTDGTETSTTKPIYSTLTGLEIANESLNSSPTYCVQIPNADDGARPQAGLNQAGVVFEAIAERGITRFAAVFQNATSSAIGPIRSLRPYYLEWDTPFDCTVVHAGGSDEALVAINNSEYRNLDENNQYMWRENAGERYWNNLFTSPSLVKSFNDANDYKKSNVQAFPRLEPDEVKEILDQRRTTTTTEEDCVGDDCTETEVITDNLVTDFEIDFGRLTSFNTIYHYDAERNVYLRSYESGEPHLVFDCPSTLNQPLTLTECGEPIQVAPSAVVAMFVRETTASDQYHEDIATVGSGKAYIFQNGTAEIATWSKSSVTAQIVFRNEDGEPISFAPGQLWIAAVPQYGGVDY